MNLDEGRGREGVNTLLGFVPNVEKWCWELWAVARLDWELQCGGGDTCLGLVAVVKVLEGMWEVE